MRIVRDIAAYEPDAGLLLSIGVFDGVHIGHREVLTRLIAQRQAGVRIGALTFEQHQQAFLRPGHAPKLLTTVDEKVNLLDTFGLDVLFLLPFDERIQSLSAQDFLTGILLQRMRTRKLVVGEGWRFGKDRAGDCELAKRVLEAAGCRFEAAALLERNGEKVSSSRIRWLIEARRFEQADALLGSPFSVHGIVVHGDGRGHVLGYPTANLALAAEKLLPGDGVYCAAARYDGADYTAVVSIGNKPTFSGADSVVEAYLLDFQRSIYGEQLVLRDWQFLREQRRYDGVHSLVAQIELDVRSVRERAGV